MGPNEEEGLENYQISGIYPSTSGSFRTFFIFLDLSQHIEFRAGEMPLVPKGTEFELDMSLVNPRKVGSKKINVQGVYHVARSVLRYSSRKVSALGASQYLELKEGPSDVLGRLGNISLGCDVSKDPAFSSSTRKLRLGSLSLALREISFLGNPLEVARSWRMNS